MPVANGVSIKITAEVPKYVCRWLFLSLLPSILCALRLFVFVDCPLSLSLSVFFILQRWAEAGSCNREAWCWRIWESSSWFWTFYWRFYRLFASLWRSSCLWCWCWLWSGAMYCSKQIFFFPNPTLLVSNYMVYCNRLLIKFAMINVWLL